MARRAPLCVRIYFEAHLADLIRVIGYQSLPVADARQQLAPLVKRYGKDKVNAAIKEVMEIDYTQQPARARLAAPVRKAAWQMLGPPPADMP